MAAAAVIKTPAKYVLMHDVPAFFSEQISKADRQQLKIQDQQRKAQRLQMAWQIDQILTHWLDQYENLDIITEIDKVHALYVAQADDKTLEVALSELLKKIGKDDNPKVNVSSDERHGLIALEDRHWREKKGDEHVIAWDDQENPLSMIRFNIENILTSNGMWRTLRDFWIKPMDKAKPDWDTLPFEVLSAEPILSVIHAVMNQNAPKEAITEQAIKVFAEHAKCQEEARKKLEKAGKCATFKKLFSFRMKSDKARRDVLDMYMYDNRVYDDEYGYEYADSLGLDAFDMDVDVPLQSQALRPLHEGYPQRYGYKVQPAVIGGYDAGNAMSNHLDMSLVMLIGVGFVTLLLCLCALMVCAVGGVFGVYLCRKQGRKFFHAGPDLEDSAV